jgi:hypothetical protein
MDEVRNYEVADPAQDWKLQQELLASYWPVVENLSVIESSLDQQYYMVVFLRSGKIAKAKAKTRDEACMVVNMHAANECEYEEVAGENN